MNQPAKPRGSTRLFTWRGIDVFLHWSWLVVALVEVQWRKDVYDSIIWNFVEYVAIFALVLLHEFGHALACRSVGGSASRIMLWPLGGVAYVQPPPRPGPMLWSIAAGPLVNLVLVPVTLGAVIVLRIAVPDAWPDLDHAMVSIAVINLVLLIFNLLPVYPLDGGQIMRSLLWFVIGRERSLLVAAGIGLVVSILGGLAVVVLLQDLWLGAIAAYAAWRSWEGLKVARIRTRILGGPRHEGYSCPTCGEAPPRGIGTRCMQGHGVDAFETRGFCPACMAPLTKVMCLSCEQEAHLAEWSKPRVIDV
jgi:Zn-dependent protease